MPQILNLDKEREKQEFAENSTQEQSSPPDPSLHPLYQVVLPLGREGVRSFPLCPCCCR